jgi:hypothetical protein
VHEGVGGIQIRDYGSMNQPLDILDEVCWG